MGQKNRFNGISRYRDWNIFKYINPLLHTAIDQIPLAAYFQQCTTAGYFMCCTNKLDLHISCLLF